MERLVIEYITLLQSKKKASTKFWELESRVEQDKKSPSVVTAMGRSTTVNNIVRLILGEMISLDKLEAFSDDLKEEVKFIAEKW